MADLMLLVPPSLEETATAALTKTLVNSGETNIVIDRPKIVPCAYLTDATKFYLLRTGQAMKPFIFQNRRPITRQMKGMDDREFKDVKFMTDARYNAGYFAWWNAVLTTFT
jgi:phage major head subunit gpT-like protein